MRNLGIMNMVLFRPIRSDQYSTGPLDVTLINKAVKNIGMAVTINARSEQAMSKCLFIRAKAGYRCCVFEFAKINSFSLPLLLDPGRVDIARKYIIRSELNFLIDGGNGMGCAA